MTDSDIVPDEIYGTIEKYRGGNDINEIPYISNMIYYSLTVTNIVIQDIKPA